MTRDRWQRRERMTMCAAYKRLRRTLADGARLGEADAEIEREPLSRDARDAVRLYAWTTTERRRQRDVAER
jgi:hypothetical protein